jgi:hypothetical protein
LGTAQTTGDIIGTLNSSALPTDVASAVWRDLLASGDFGVTASIGKFLANIFSTQMVESWRATGAMPTLAQAMIELLSHFGNASISGTTLTLTALDQVTPTKTFTLNDPATPTSVKEAT